MKRNLNIEKRATDQALVYFLLSELPDILLIPLTDAQT